MDRNERDLVLEGVPASRSSNDEIARRGNDGKVVLWGIQGKEVRTRFVQENERGVAHRQLTVEQPSREQTVGRLGYERDLRQQRLLCEASMIRTVEQLKPDAWRSIHPILRRDVLQKVENILAASQGRVEKWIFALSSERVKATDPSFMGDERNGDSKWNRAIWIPKVVLSSKDPRDALWALSVQQERAFQESEIHKACEQKATKHGQNHASYDKSRVDDETLAEWTKAAALGNSRGLEVVATLNAHQRISAFEAKENQDWKLFHGALSHGVARRAHELIATVKAGDADEAYALTQHIDRDWRDNTGVKTARDGRVRSTTVGDIVVDEKGNGYMCAAIGWDRLGPNELGKRQT